MRRDAKDDDDRSGRKLWLEYKRRSAKANNKRKREDTQRINLEAPKTDLQARSTYPVGGERCSVSHYLTPLDGRQVRCEFDNWINGLKQQTMRKRNAKSAAGLNMQSTGKLPQNWSFKRYWQRC